MISLALMLMTLPSRMAEVRARHGESSTGRADRAQQRRPSTEVADSSPPERCSGGRRSPTTRRVAAASASTTRNDSSDNGPLKLWQR
jgi:hypothetical protein